MVWYIDGIVVNRIIPQRGGSGDGIKVRRFPTAAMNVTLNLAMDPTWFASTTRSNCCVTDATTQTHFYNPGGNEVNMAIDFVRVSKP